MTRKDLSIHVEPYPYFDSALPFRSPAPIRPKRIKEQSACKRELAALRYAARLGACKPLSPFCTDMADCCAFGRIGPKWGTSSIERGFRSSLEGERLSDGLRTYDMFKALQYYWNAARGYRLNPWKSPYLRWRFETFLGKEAANLTPGKFFQLMWKYRDHMERFVDWAAERRQFQRRRHA